MSKLLSENGFVIINQFCINDELDASVLTIGENENNKTLGIDWNANHDFLQYCVNIKNDSDIFTKRRILSILCQIYDPLGLINPVIVSGKLFIQELWRLKQSWDEEVPNHVTQAWIKFEQELLHVIYLKIPRLYIFANYSFIKIHGFSDASEKAYGAALYIKCCVPNKGYCVNLLCAKSRVAPLKKVSLPRLELCAAVLLANLAYKVCKSIKIAFTNRYFWTDSTITLAWIKAEPNTWKTFNANRVTEIKTFS